jgi:hypothetical protein
MEEEHGPMTLQMKREMNLKNQSMIEFLQKGKIITVSIISLIGFGVLLSVFAWSLEQGDYFLSGLLLVFLCTEVSVSYLWMHRLHRVLLVIRYKKFKDDQKEEDDREGTNH